MFFLKTWLLGDKMVLDYKKSSNKFLNKLLLTFFNNFGLCAPAHSFHDN